jgi:hypothetical protein
VLNPRPRKERTTSPNAAGPGDAIRVPLTASRLPSETRTNQARRGSPFTLKVDATARDNQSTQDNEKHNASSGRPWVGPPTVVARSTSAFRVSIYHPIRQTSGALPSSACPGSGHNKGPASAGPEEEPFRRRLLCERRGFHNPLPTQAWKHRFVPFELMCVERPDPPICRRRKSLTPITLSEELFLSASDAAGVFVPSISPSRATPWST